MKKYAIIVAGGSGSRMKSDIPKQFLLLNHKPVLMHTIERFYNYDRSINIILVLPISQQHYWKELCIKYDFNIDYQLADGGKERFFSVKNGLEKTDDNCIIAIHDGVRPLVSDQTLANCFETAQLLGNAIPITELVESLRQVKDLENFAVSRSEYRLVQTPQVFKSEIIKEAYDTEFRSEFTDDASIVEASGYSINMVEGNCENIKITNPTDLIVAEALHKCKEH